VVRDLKVGCGIGMYVAKKIEKSARGLVVELARPYDPVAFTVKFSYPVLP
jgi:hypothetical protein